MRRLRRSFYLLPAMLTGLTLSGPHCWADDVAKAAVAKLLEVGWGDSFRVLEPARAEFEKAKAAAPRDPRVPYAFALVNIKHGRHSEAAKLLDEALSLDSKHLPAREAKLWVDVLLKRYAAALVQIDQLAGMLTAKDEPGAADETRSRQLETARYLGRLIGFLEGPAEKAANAERVAETKKSVLERLSAEQREAFEAGRKAVADRFAEFFGQREQAREDAIADQKKSQEETAKRLAEDKATIASDKKAIAKQAEQTREQVEKIISEIERKLAPLDKEYARLSAQAVSVRERMIDVDRDVSRLLRLAEITEDPVAAARYRIEADRLSDVWGSYSREYRALQAQAERVRGQQAVLLNERAAVVARYNAEAKRLGQEQIKLAQTEKRIAREEDRNRKKPTGNESVAAISAKVYAFTTYEPFPLEKSRSRVLETLR